MQRFSIFLKSTLENSENTEEESALQAINREALQQKLTALIAQSCPQVSPHRPYNLFALDCTSAPRPFAKTLSERGVVHTANPSPGNKPICIGHQYSLLAYLPEQINVPSSWLLPLSIRRVFIEQKGSDVGIEQLTQLVNDATLPFHNQLSVAVGDTAYSSLSCRKLLSPHEHLVFISRIASNRNVYPQPIKTEQPDNAEKEFKRPKWFGNKMNLGKAESMTKADNAETTEYINKKQERLKVTLSIWNDTLFRGTKDYPAHEDPFTLIKIHVTDSNDRAIYKKPIWLKVQGKRRHEISAIAAFKSYKQRYDVEHFFRFGKQKLLMDKYQTPETQHEENWWHICLLAYTQLYLAKALANKIPHHWERTLPNYKDDTIPATSSQVQKDFSRILSKTGTPAKAPLTRGLPEGRKPGEQAKKRAKQAITYKTEQKQLPITESTIDSLTNKPVTIGFEKIAKVRKPINYADIVLKLKELLSGIDMCLDEFLEKTLAELPT